MFSSSFLPRLGMFSQFRAISVRGWVITIQSESLPVFRTVMLMGILNLALLHALCIY